MNQPDPFLDPLGLKLVNLVGGIAGATVRTIVLREGGFWTWLFDIIAGALCALDNFETEMSAA